MVARLLGAEDVGEGIAIAENRIAIGGSDSLIVAGPALRPGARVGWSVRPDRVRLSATGCYEATIENVIAVGSACEVSVRLGTGFLRFLADPSGRTLAGGCRLDIDPGSIQVWQTE
jgi:hypothetical protein